MANIQPVIDYIVHCTLWGLCAKFNLEHIPVLVFQKRASRIITKVQDQNVSAPGLSNSTDNICHNIIMTVLEQIHYVNV